MFNRRYDGTMSDNFDPDEKFDLPDDTDPDEVLRKLLGVKEETVAEDQTPQSD